MSTHRPRADHRRRPLLATVAAAGLLVLLVIPARAQEPVLVIDWTTTTPASGIVSDGIVEVTAGQQGGVFPLVSVTAPDLGRAGYVVSGQVRYSDVVGAAYLELWSVFADGSRYFSRTLATDGAMALLTGSSDWRPFEIPFSLQGGEPPNRLEINVVLPGAGTVGIGTLRLSRVDAAPALDQGQAIGLAGAVIGTTIGLYSALVSWLVGRRRARAFVIPSMTVLAGLGIVAIVAGAVAAILGTSLNVVIALVLPGIIVATAMRLAQPAIRAAYADAELRRMRAMDSG
jgi:hypothetical protein